MEKQSMSDRNTDKPFQLETIHDSISEINTKNVKPKWGKVLESLPRQLSLKLISCQSLHETEDVLFDMLKEKEEQKVSVGKFWQALLLTGLRRSDPRLAEAKAHFDSLVDTDGEGRGDVLVDKVTFRNCIQSNIYVINKAFKDELVIPEFTKFTKEIQNIYENVSTNTNGKPAQYIPQLARADPTQWAVSVCSIDGQRFALGPTKTPYCIQSCCKPLNYALALSDLGPLTTHKYVGQEPSGQSFNELTLSSSKKPHNPMINSGAIVITSLLKPSMQMADRFDHVQKSYRRLAGGEYVGFSNATYLSERETADRNFSLGYYMREHKCFPEGSDLMQTLEFYFMLCSVEINAESGSVIAATLANGGICPITGERVLEGDAVRNTLSLMHSCGMYDYSGQFAFKVGLPAKSGVAGCILLVVPNVMGICCWAPPLDELGNSCKGIQFFEELVSRFNFHNYDNLLHTHQKLDPRKRSTDKSANNVVNLLFGAANGDVTAVRRFALMGMDMSSADYDGRTALHLAAAEGHLTVVQMLLERCHVRPEPRDRWGFTPVDDARRFGHKAVVTYLESYSQENNTSQLLSPPTRD